MIRVRTRKIFFLLLSTLLILFLINRYLTSSDQNDTNELGHGQSYHRYPRSQRNFSIDTLTLHSKCLCQPEIVTINKYPTYYNIRVHNVYNPTLNNTDNFFSYNMTKAHFEDLLVTCDLYKVLRRGPKQNVVSYSLKEGSEDELNFFKNIYILNVRRTVGVFYRGWIGRVYYDGRKMSQSDVCSLECGSLRGVTDPVNNVDFCDVSEMPFDLGERRWDASRIPTGVRRYLPIGDGFVDVFVSRDVDSCTYDRELTAVTEWIEDKTLFHTMRDHYTHDSRITPGLWGFMLHFNRILAKDLFHLIIENSFLDQQLLDYKVWPHFKRNKTIHDSYHCAALGGQPFPNQREHNNCYVGMFGCCGAVLNVGIRLMECPEECRPIPHKNQWIYC